MPRALKAVRSRSLHTKQTTPTRIGCVGVIYGLHVLAHRHKFDHVPHFPERMMTLAIAGSLIFVKLIRLGPCRLVAALFSVLD